MAKVYGSVYWAKLKRPDQFGRWSIDVCLETPEAVKKFRKEFPYITIKNKGDERGDFVQFKRNIKNANGEDVQPPRVVDRGKAPFTQLIGNGSKCWVVFSEYPIDNKFKKGMGCSLSAVQVVELVPFVTDGTAELDDLESAEDELEADTPETTEEPEEEREVEVKPVVTKLVPKAKPKVEDEYNKRKIV